MATISSLTVKIGADVSALQKGLNKASRQVKDFGKGMSSVGKTLSASITAPLAALGGVALKQAADFEKLRTSMDILNESTEEGARNFERLKTFSAETPFQFQDLAKAQNMLQGFGLEADHAFNSLSMIGDIAAATGSDVNSIARVFGKSAAEGRLMTEEILQLVDNGVPAFKLLAETMGVPQSEIRKLAETGQISFETLQKAFKNTTKEGGIYEDGMKKQSQTISGLFSTLRDNASNALSELGQSIADAFNLKDTIPALIERIQQVTEWFSRLSSESRKKIILITTAIAGIGPALIAIGGTITALGVTFAALTSPIGLVVGAIAGLSAAILYIWDNWKAVKERISDIGWWRNAIISMVQFWADYNPFRLIIKGYNKLLDALGMGQIPDPFKAMSDTIEGLKGKTKEYEHEFGSFIDAVNNGIQSLTGFDLSNLFTTSSGGYGGGGEDPSVPVRRVATETANLTREFHRVNEVSNPIMEKMRSRMSRQANATAIAMDIANQFTDSFGQGMANVVLQGQNLVDTLKNIGKLLASSIIQKGLSILLTGGLGGSGFFGKGGGLFGKIFGVNDALITSGGDVVKFHPDDNILAMKDFSGIGGSQRVEVFGTLKGNDIFVSSSRGGDTYGR